MGSKEGPLDGGDHMQARPREAGSAVPAPPGKKAGDGLGLRVSSSTNMAGPLIKAKGGILISLGPRIQ